MVHRVSCPYACSTFLRSLEAPHSAPSTVTQNQTLPGQVPLPSHPHPIDHSMIRQRTRSLFLIPPMTTPLGGIGSHSSRTAVPSWLISLQRTAHLCPFVLLPSPYPHSCMYHGLRGAPPRRGG